MDPALPPEQNYVFEFSATDAGFTEAFLSFRRLLDTQSLTPRVRYRCELVFEEVVTNILRYAHPHGGDHRVEVIVDCGGPSPVLTFEDDGIPFDSAQPMVPAVPDGAATPGGRGLTLVRRVSTELHYTRAPHAHNMLRVTIATE